MEKSPALGKGLSALIPDMPEVRPAGGTNEVDVDQISPNDHQPRHRFEDAGLDELAQSIKTNGVIQPIVVRKVDGGYRIIAGERRWRAAQRAGLTRVPVVVKEVGAGQDARLLQMALIENIQREELDPDRRGGRVRKAEERIQPDAGGNRRRSRQGPLVSREPYAPAEAAAGGSRRSRRRPPFDGTCASAPRARGRRSPTPGRPGGDRPQSVGTRDRNDGQTVGSRRIRGAKCAAPSATCTRGPPRRSCG